jgi:hypothetical protein
LSVKREQLYRRNKKSRARNAGNPITAKSLIYRDFSLVEDDKHFFRLIHQLASDAGHYAAAEAKARGLSPAYFYANKLMKISPEGEETLLTPKLGRKSFYVKFNPHKILHVVKK